MSRPPRYDSPGAWYHVMNRGMARRTLFELSCDVNRFLELLGEATERGDLEVHSYSILTTHYHLLVRSPAGRLSFGMQRVQTEYSRWFNRSRRRDGPLVRGRYTAKRVGSLIYRRAVVAYIDRNPVAAGLCQDPVEYPHGSARLYGTAGPSTAPWLTRSWVEPEVLEATGKPLYAPSEYPGVFLNRAHALDRVVESRLHASSSTDPLDDLIAAAPERVLEWMQRKAKLADGTAINLPVADMASVMKAVRKSMGSARENPESPWMIDGRDATTVMSCGLLRRLCGMTFDGIAEATEQPVTTVRRLIRLHGSWTLNDASYGRAVAAFVQGALSVRSSPVADA